MKKRLICIVVVLALLVTLCPAVGLAAEVPDVTAATLPVEGEPVEPPDEPQPPEQPQEPEVPQEPVDVEDIPLVGETPAPEQPAQVEEEAEYNLPELEGLAARCTAYNAITLTWTKTPGATGYVVSRATSRDGTYRTVVTLGDVDKYVNDKLSTGSTYYYKVQAFAEQMQGPPSAPVHAKTVLDKLGGLRSERVSYNSVRIRWSRVQGANKYIVYRSTRKTQGFKPIKTLGKVTAYRDSGLVTGKTYYYKVRPVRQSVQGALSNAVSAKATLDKLKNLKAASMGVGSIRVTWSRVKGANKYVIYRSRLDNYWGASPNSYKVIATLGGEHSSFVDNAARQGNTYYYKIVPYRQSAKGTMSGAAKAKVPLSASVSGFINAARSHVGKAYVWGGKGPNVFDCSGLVYYSLNQCGYKIRYMTSTGWTNSSFHTIYSTDELQAGDILCYPGHVAIYTGDNRTIEARNPSVGVIEGYANGLDGYQCAKRVF